MLMFAVRGCESASVNTEQHRTAAGVYCIENMSAQKFRPAKANQVCIINSEFKSCADGAQVKAAAGSSPDDTYTLHT